MAAAAGTAVLGLVSDEPAKTSGVLGLDWSSLKLELPAWPAWLPPDAGSGLSAGCCCLEEEEGLPNRLLGVGGASFSLACTLPGFR